MCEIICTQYERNLLQVSRDEGNDLYVRFARGAAASFRGLLSNQSCDRVQVPCAFSNRRRALIAQRVVLLCVVLLSAIVSHSDPIAHRRIVGELGGSLSFAQIHVQHAAGNQAAGEDEETKSAADDPVFQSVHDSGPGGWLRGRVQGVESPFPLGRLLHRALIAGKNLTIFAYTTCQTDQLFFLSNRIEFSLLR